MGNKITSPKKGFTLIELIVAMSIFSVVMLVAVGAFISMNNLRAVAMNFRESQQKLRMAEEIMARYSRQAEKVILVNPDATGLSKDLRLFFNVKSPGSRYGERFLITNSRELQLFECIPQSEFDECGSVWGSSATGQNLLGGDVKIDTSKINGFVKNEIITLSGSATQSVAVPASLSIKLAGWIESNNKFYDNKFNLQTRIILENVK